MILEHIERFGEFDKSASVAGCEQVVSILPDWKIWVGTATTAKHRGMRVAVTDGLCSGTRRHEYCVVASDLPDSAIQVLLYASYWSLTKRALHVGNVLQVGMPWAEGSSLDCVLVSHPYPFGPKFETVRENCTILWLMPISSSEFAFAQDRGTDALEDKFEMSRVKFANLLRAPVL